MEKNIQKSCMMDKHSNEKKLTKKRRQRGREKSPGMRKI